MNNHTFMGYLIYPILLEKADKLPGCYVFN